MTRAALFLLTITAACVGAAPDGPGASGDADGAVVDAGAPGDAASVRYPTCTPVDIPITGARAVEIMAAGDLASVAATAPCIGDPAVAAVLSSPRTMWYDARSIKPGYQDSFGDNVIAPIGMRPNTIDSGLIDLAVPGGHAQIFDYRGVFHFPFGNPGGFGDAAFPVDFWSLPYDGGAPIPVVWWKREPNGLTHRVEWMFPRGTVLGEILYMTDADGNRYPFEIRTRTRELDKWVSNAYRPFPTAESFARALELKRLERPQWMVDDSIDALIAHLRDPSTLSAASLSDDHFPGSFPTIDGAVDRLPALADDSIIEELLYGTPFVSVRDTAWKSGNGLTAYAATTDAAFSIVPRGYNGGLVRVDDDTCNRCHRDAGRPFRDWYDNILAYGELWGEDESFSWHPFADANFVDGDGDVVNFNYDNRVLRRDFIDGGVLAPYSAGEHPDSLYRKLPGPWKDYAY